jgi:beta-galactosidase
VKLMSEAGVGFATVGVFSWAKLQPEPGRFDFGWLDRVLDLLHGAGIAVDLATATASAPAWLHHRHPETLVTDADGRRLWPGSRQSWCPSSPVFRDHALALVEALATRYRGHPALAMWHVSNELGCHNPRCYCDISAEAFRTWLRERYGDLESLNEAWGTAFWSQHYGDWSHVLPPRRTTAISNPTQLLDFSRFSSDALLDCFLAERDLLHRLTPGVPVTTNFMLMPHVAGMDYFRWAPEQDLVSNDHYLDHTRPHHREGLAFCADLSRGVAGGRPWFLMEHSPSAVNWQPVNVAKQPGELLRTSLAHVSRGADAVGFFQWRASRAGAEKFHSALVPHAGTDTRVWREVVRLGGVLSRAGEAAGSRVRADVALVLDWHARWACAQGSHPSSAFGYLDAGMAIHRALWNQGVTADVVHAGSDLSGYRLVVVPTLYLVDDATAARIARYVASGGHVLVTYFSGIVDEHDHIRLGGYPGAFAGLLGVRTEEFYPLRAGEQVAIDVAADAGEGLGPGWTGTVWTELTRLAGATAVARYADGPVAGGPAVTRHETGAGVAWYLGSTLDDAALAELVSRACRDAGVSAEADVPPGVEVVRRHGEAATYLFVLNHTREPVSIAASGYDLVAEAEVDGRLVVAGGDCALVREDGVRQGEGRG